LGLLNDEDRLVRVTRIGLVRTTNMQGSDGFPTVSEEAGEIVRAN
jgi:hypothetical protein